ncbi:DNA-binding response OmpR family regulator [Isoptericola sp. CG 20/1183]|uniref:DNA-binding response OmpR family regulator n=1 Tax=Isoptericola halotolerans TaxID=300560 RepID=A0ABX5EGL4_9MICO|nr:MULTISPECIES: response regulator transcription factor [Isoptericola]PRZ08637.1 DNA-binding response OmpR family regulator [Isoptericola halotolerans]PRZ10916.1 DNA-binding response OmpR family regulator [Isoptericola sp. CG 20/1183]
MVRVLVVDDDATVADVVVAYLERAGLSAERAVDGLDALAAATTRPPDAVVLDLMLPGLDGIEVCRRLRADRPGLPILMLTARGEEEDRIAGLEVGADDYVTKPFSPRELTLRVQSVLRRAGALAPHPAGPGSAPPEPPSGTLRDGDLELDVAAHRVLRRGAELPVTAREFDLLAWFLAHPGQVHDRETLLREVWGWEFGDRSTVTVHVRRLREKVEADPSRPVRLVTVFGVGYRWDTGSTA